jgi:hypothetical protein
MSDGFDDYEGWDNAHSGRAGDELAAECALVDGIAAASSLREVLAQVRASTRQSLDERLGLVRGGKPVQKTFALLWQAQGPGFGVYGCEDDFGERELRCDGERYQVAPASTSASRSSRGHPLFRRDHRAVRATAVALRGLRCAPTEDRSSGCRRAASARCHARKDALSRRRTVYPMKQRLRELEEIVVDAWPAAEAAEQAGWLLRTSGGPTHRGNRSPP